MIVSHCYGDQTKNGEMDGTCSTYGGDEKYIKIYVRNTVYDTVDWFYLLQERVNCQTFVNTLMNLLVP
jgi:hypothetical protein